MANKKAIVVGAGIVGLAMARALALKGFSVSVFERGAKATGASIRNFGMIWPIGQPSGKLYSRAKRSRDIWREIGDAGTFWYENAGSLHVAYHKDEMRVLEEVYTALKEERNLRLLSAGEIAAISPATVTENLLGGLHSEEELIVDPREAIASLPAYLEQNLEVKFFWNNCVTAAGDGKIITAAGRQYEADLVFICSGADFETLYPEKFAELNLTKCKLQMMRMPAQPQNWRIGPALCGGLSLIHYKSFASAPSLPELKKRFETELPDYLKWGIHVMVSQNGNGELTVGDSHEYGISPDPFDREFINRMITGYLAKFARFKNDTVAETWNGVYSKSTTGETEIFLSPETGVYIVNALSGAGMTLSFGLAEELVSCLV
jgi:FAD dependent oxidoreductase TIGR03364